MQVSARFHDRPLGQVPHKRMRGPMSTKRGLSDTELSIIQALAGGLQSKEIAVRLGRTRPAIEFHIRMLYAKLDAKSRAHLVALAYQSGLLPTREEPPVPELARA